MGGEARQLKYESVKFMEDNVMCYWNYFNIDEADEGAIALWEYEQERKDYMSDWDDYVNGF